MTVLTGLRAPDEIRLYRSGDGRLVPYTWEQNVAMDFHDEMESEETVGHRGDHVCPRCTPSSSS